MKCRMHVLIWWSVSHGYIIISTIPIFINEVTVTKKTRAVGIYLRSHTASKKCHQVSTGAGHRSPPLWPQRSFEFHAHGTHSPTWPKLRLLDRLVWIPWRLVSHVDSYPPLLYWDLAAELYQLFFFFFTWRGY